MSHCPKGNNISGCPWRQDPKDNNHYRCLDCGKHRYINDSSSCWGCLVWIVLAIVVLVFIASCGESPNIEEKKPVVTVSH